MGLVDANGKVNFYDGRISVVAPDGKRSARTRPAEYRDWIAEHVEPWTYLKFPYLKQIGWQGFVDGKQSGVYMATPLGRLNAADGMATPLAQEAYERFYATLSPSDGNGSRRVPVHQSRRHPLGATDRDALCRRADGSSWSTIRRSPRPTFRTVPTQTPTEGVGTVEAPRGTLTHHYWTDERGILTHVNLIVGTTNNHAPIAMSIDRAARGLIHHGVVVDNGLLDRIEMAFRAYDPCFGCATHSLPGQMPLEVTLRNSDGETVDVLRRD